MKKLFLQSAIIGSSFLGLARLGQAEGMSVGVVGGLNWYKTTFAFGGVDYETDSKTGFLAGLSSDFALGGAWALGPELLFSSKQSKVAATTLKVNYLDLPILVKYKFQNTSAFT